MNAAMIPLHPQQRGRPDEMHWLLPSGVLPFTGDVARAPHAVSTLLEDGTLTQVRLEQNAVITRLAPGRSWPDDGPRVRTALHAALADPGGWQPHEETLGPADVPDEDDALRRAAEQLLSGPAGDLIRSHGGRIDVIAVHDGIVEVSLHGTCDGCPRPARP